MRVAYVHDWLVTYRGGEKVLDALLELYPEAPIYTLFYDRAAMPASIQRRVVHLPPAINGLRRLRKLMLPVLPALIESFDLSKYDLIISTSSCVAKGVRHPANTMHLCYLHSPMRYIWDQQEEYIRGVAHIPFAPAAIRAMTPRLRKWDVASAERVDQFIVNSHFVGSRAQEYYGREALVVPPPIELGRFVPKHATTKRGGYFLAAGALVSYKRFDLAIQACEALGVELIIAGAGPMEHQLRKMAGSHTRFEIMPNDDRFLELLQNAEALLFPGVEDFGMIAIEAMATGTPVIAYEKGGALDFIEEGRTGHFFREASAASLIATLQRFEPATFDADNLALYAQQYGREPFLARIRGALATMLGGRSS